MNAANSNSQIAMPVNLIAHPLGQFFILRFEFDVRLVIAVRSGKLDGFAAFERLHLGKILVSLPVSF